MKASKHWGVVLDLGRRCIYGADLSRLVANAKHAIREGEPLPRIALLGVESNAAAADKLAKFFSGWTPLRGFWLVQNGAKVDAIVAEHGCMSERAAEELERL